ncbi:murein transglycosylase A [Ostreiculturibacter nitratireducens]|uniref:murein transglycosylase A n=2 Tax=Ostreiculturibacter nitratireducens TaxID=3075226 RepID=UPI0031B5A012
MMSPAARVSPASLPGWEADDHGAALSAYSETADLLPAGWPRPERGDWADPRGFFERHFHAVTLGEPPAFFTGYYEPEFEGRAEATEEFAYPLHSVPDGLVPGEPWHDRAEIETRSLLAGRELIWLSSPVEAFFVQVQGSVRVRLPGGRVRRFGHAAKNGHPYRSIGEELIRRGEIAEAEMSAQVIRGWCAAHPGEVAGLLRHNPSFVFFRLLDLPEDKGPLGAMGRSVTAGRTLAVDPAHHPLGAPVWVAVDGPEQLRRLTVAQDTGSAIKGPQRGDLFCGSGPEAGRIAGAMRRAGRMVTFLPLSEGRA